MKAIQRRTYGPPRVVERSDVEQPLHTDDGVLVRVRAASLNAGDWYAMTGIPYVARGMMGGFLRPNRTRLGNDFAGTVEAVGAAVTDLRPGDDVFGSAAGALAEYVCARKAVARKPANLSFEQAAAVPVAALTALQGLRDHGQLRPGQRVLVNGASGSVGTFAVQLARALGAEVTAVCSTRNVEQARALGATHVVDYTREDFTRSGRRHDLLLDVAGGRSWRACRRALADTGAYVGIGGPRSNPWLEPLGHVAAIRLGSLRATQRVVPLFIAKLSREDLLLLHDLLAAGTVTPMIDRTYSLNQTAAAFEYLAQGHARGKIVITI